MNGSCSWFPMGHDAIRAWVMAHEYVLSANLAEISRYPIPFRKVMVAMMAPEHRLAVWRQHLESVAAADGTITSEQKAFVGATSAALPALFGAASPSSAIKEWETSAAVLFTPAQAARIFGTLGPPEPPEGLPLPSDAQPGP